MSDELVDAEVVRPGRARFPVVGIGASAGGLEAFTQLLHALPPDTGMAFVLLQHLSPTHPSTLAEILGRATKMPVREASDAQAIEPNCVYVIPPGRCMSIAGSMLALEPRDKTGPLRVIDHFFRSLAEESGHRAIGVVLSGTATDGTLGLEAIKAEGGIGFAQDASAQHDGMPSSAIASGCVDYVLSPAGIAQELARIAAHPHAETGSISQTQAPDLGPIVELLLVATGVDFAQYRFNTLYRRVTRRMALKKTEGLDEYVRLLRDSASEVEALYQDLLIGVTSFFRNPEAFDSLCSGVFPRLLRERARHDPVRFWTLGCSTGQEAYSLAIAYTEFAESVGSKVALQVFATDLSSAAVDKARLGVYPKDIAQDVSAGRLRRFFTEVEGGYRIGKSIRDLCVFSRHNVLSDPPFSRMDLISCRNLLIYIEPVLQQKVVQTLHYALKPTGCLWLGGSETVGSQRMLFDAQDTRHKVYFKKPGTGRAHDGGRLPHGVGLDRVLTPPVATPTLIGADLPREADRILMSRYAPPAVLVSTDLDILKYTGDTQAYLSPAAGMPSLSLLKMLRESLLVGVRAAVQRAQQEQVAVREEGLRLRTDDGWRDIAVEVIPVKASTVDRAGYLILFEDPSRPLPSRAAVAPPPETDAQRLAQELAATRDYLQSIIEQQEAANEQLQAASEEVQSANEELQSTNEELETSKEEIQSSNEELATVNDELNNRNQELNRLNNDLHNLIDSVQIATVIVGPDLRIRRFTPMAASQLRLDARDIGRPIVDLKLQLDDPLDLEPLLLEVLATQETRERELRDRQGHWYSLRLRPYRTEDGGIDGVVVMLVDIDAVKRAQVFDAQFRTLADGIPNPAWMSRPDGEMFWFNQRFYEYTGTTFEQMQEHGWEAVHDPDASPRVQSKYEDALRSGQAWEDSFPMRDRVGGFRWYLARMLPVRDGQGNIVLWFGTATDIHDQRDAAEALRRNAAELSSASVRKDEFIATLAHELRNPLAPMQNAVHLLRAQAGDAAAVARSVDTMARQLAQMVHLVDDLLDVSRIRHGKVELHKGPMELASIVHQSVESIRALADARKQTISVNLPQQPIWLNADPTRIAQVLGNLLNNACKYSERSAPISLSVTRVGSHVEVRVRDWGIGIGKEQLPLIFDMFVQADGTLHRSMGGLGIGLALARRMIELHDGSLEARSEGPGLGSEFVVRLPIDWQAKATAPKVALPALAVIPARILVVDDNHDTAETMATLLEFDGHQTRVAFDGEEAVVCAGEFEPEVVLLDIGLPKLDGYQTARRIRALSCGKSAMLIALTGWGQAEDRAKALEAGFDHHLVKPADHLTLQLLLASRGPKLAAVGGP